MNLYISDSHKMARHVAGIMLSPSSSLLWPYRPLPGLYCSQFGPYRSLPWPNHSQLVPYSSQLVPSCLAETCCVPQIFATTSNVDGYESPLRRVFLQYHENGRITVFCLTKQGTFSSPLYEMRCKVWQYSFMSIHLQTGIVEPFSGKLYVFRDVILPQDNLEELSGITRDRSLSPHVYSSTCDPSMRVCTYTSEPIAKDEDRRPILPYQLLSIGYHSSALGVVALRQSSQRSALKLIHQPLISLQATQDLLSEDISLSSHGQPSSIAPSSGYHSNEVGAALQQSSLSSRSELKPIHQPLISLPEVSGKQHATQDRLSEDINLPRQPRSITPSEKKLMPPAKCSKRTTKKPRHDAANQMEGHCQFLTKKKRSNSINFKKGLMESTRRQSHCSLFRGVSTTCTSSAGSEESSSASSEENRDDSEEVRRKPQSLQPHSDSLQHGQLSSYGITTDGENALLPSKHSAKLSPNSTKSHAGGLAERRIQLQPRSSLIQPTEESYNDSCNGFDQKNDIGGHQYHDRLKDMYTSGQEVTQHHSDSPTPIPQGLFFSHDSSSQSLGLADNAFGTFNELIEPDYGIPRLDCAEDNEHVTLDTLHGHGSNHEFHQEVTNYSQAEHQLVQQPTQETQAQGGESEMAVAPITLPPGLRLLFLVPYVVQAVAVPQQPREIKASIVGTDTDYQTHNALVEPHDEELVKKNP